MDIEHKVYEVQNAYEARDFELELAALRNKLNYCNTTIEMIDGLITNNEQQIEEANNKPSKLVLYYDAKIAALELSIIMYQLHKNDLIVERDVTTNEISITEAEQQLRQGNRSLFECSNYCQTLVVKNSKILKDGYDRKNELKKLEEISREKFDMLVPKPKVLAK